MESALADGSGKYSTPGASVIIYLALEIGLADTAGRFNGRTMLELTKTKTKHQLGDFFFQHLPVCLLGLKVLLPRGWTLAVAYISKWLYHRKTTYSGRTILVSAPLVTRLFAFGAQVAALSQIMANKLLF